MEGVKYDGWIAMDRARSSILSMPRRITVLNMLVNAVIALALLAAYIKTGEKGALLGLLIVLLLIPTDLVLVYSILKTSSQTLLEALEVVERTGPTVVMAPLGLRLEATWWRTGTVYTLHYTPRKVHVVKVRYTRIVGESRAGPAWIVYRPSPPVKPGKCSWNHWSGVARIRAPHPRGLVDVEGHVEAWAYACDTVSPSIVKEALAKAGLDGAL